jgi:hypothetical protein
MERLQVDFAMQRGHEMIIRRDPPLARADLDEVDLQMLQAVRPRGLLAVDWFEMDGGVTFRYAIDGRKLLQHRLITGPFGMKEYLGFMLGIVEALDNCGHYLLRESCCLLEEKFLFVGDDWRDAALAYLPFRDPPVKKPVREELLGLAVRLIGKVERVDGDAVQTLLRLLDDPAARWSDIRIGLLRLMAPDRPAFDGPSDNGSRAYRIASDAGQPNSDGSRAYRIASDTGLSDADGDRSRRFTSDAGRPESGHPADGEWRAEAGPPDSVHGWQPVHASAQSDHRTGEPADRLQSADGEPQSGGMKNRFDLLGRLIRVDKSADTPPPETLMFDDREWPGRIRDTGRARWMSACGAVLATALIWRSIYLPSPGTDRLLISLGATLLAAGGLFLLWQRLAAKSREPLDDSRSAAGSGTEFPEGGRLTSWRPEARSGSRSDDGVRTDEAEIRFPWLAEFGRDDRFSPDVPSHDGGSGMDTGFGMETGSSTPGSAMPDMAAAGALAAGDETGLLQDETVLLGRDGGAFWLVREHEGQHRRIPVEPGVQVIGRSEAHARIVDTAEGVSRAHLEIASDGAEVRIKDLASRNGTLLGGEIMVPYKEYVLGDGDMFRLAGPDGPKYTLRKGG